MRHPTLPMLLVIAVAVSAPLSALAGQWQEEAEFHSAGELLTWCQDEARAYYASRGITTYQWTGRHFEHGNTLHAEGKIRADGKDVPVACQVPKGAREHFAVFQIAPPVPDPKP